MDKLQAGSMLEAMATEVIKITGPIFETMDFETPRIREGAEMPKAEVKKVTPREYGLVAWVDEVPEHQLWVAMIRQAILDMPSARCKLIWRAYPDYEVENDFATGKDRHRAYFRLGWLKEW